MDRRQGLLHVLRATITVGGDTESKEHERRIACGGLPLNLVGQFERWDANEVDRAGSLGEGGVMDAFP